jgi:NADH pyrophosphatase NudC (nudix superfamily)
MTASQPRITTVRRHREFVCHPAVVQAFIVDDYDQILLLSRPAFPESWEVVSGALEAEETILEAVLREVREEIGDQVRVHPLGTVHARTFAYDSRIQYVLSIGYLLTYEGGTVHPGDDMEGSEARWWRWEELSDPSVKLRVPRNEKWQIQRALELHRLWRDCTVSLQPPRDTLFISKKM